MTSGTHYKQGDILLVPFPYSDGSGMKQRPVLVLSKTPLGDDIITCAITSNLADREHSVLIDNASLAEGSIPVQSRVKVGKLFTLEARMVRKKLGRMNAAAFAQVREVFLALV